MRTVPIIDKMSEAMYKPERYYPQKILSDYHDLSVLLDIVDDLWDEIRWAFYEKFTEEK